MTMKKWVGCSALLVLVYSASICSADLVAHWSFDETSGTTAAESVGGHDATLKGNAEFAPGEGRFGGALDLRNNASHQGDRTDYAEFGWDEVFDTDTYTISTWFNLAAELNPDGGDPGIHFGLHGNRANDGNGGWGSEVAGYSGLQNLRSLIPTGSGRPDVTTKWQAEIEDWNMATWVIDGVANEARAYANGQLTQVYTGGRNTPPLADAYSLDPESLYPNPGASGEGFRIGDTGAANERFIGMLDDMGIWDHALSPEEVAGVYVNGVPEPSTMMMLLVSALVGFSVCAWRRRRR